MTELLAAPPGTAAATPFRRSRHRAAGAGLALVLALALAACGSGGSGDGGVVSLVDPSASASASPSASVDPEEAMLAFTKCMREHGVDIQVSVATEGGPGVGIGPGVQVGGTTDVKGAPDDPQTPTELDPKAMQAANEACQDLLPAGGMGDPNATMDPAVQDQMLAFATCMRDHGVDFPDPDSTGGGVAIQIGGEDGGGIDPGSDTFQEAQTACSAELPGGGGFVAPAPAVKP